MINTIKKLNTLEYTNFEEEYLSKVSPQKQQDVKIVAEFVYQYILRETGLNIEIGSQLTHIANTSIETYFNKVIKTLLDNLVSNETQPVKTIDINTVSFSDLQTFIHNKYILYEDVLMLVTNALAVITEAKNIIDYEVYINVVKKLVEAREQRIRDIINFFIITSQVEVKGLLIEENFRDKDGNDRYLFDYLKNKIITEGK